MKKLFYSLVITLFALNISAQSVYIVSEDANAPEVTVLSSSYNITPLNGTIYAKAWEISGGTGDLMFSAGDDIFEIIAEPSVDKYYKIEFSSGIYTLSAAYNNTYSTKLYINSEVESRANLELLTTFKTNVKI